MLIYWLIFLIPALGVLTQRRLTSNSRTIMWFLVGVLLALIIGLRHEVGGDWNAYLRALQRVQSLSLSEVLIHRGDPGYYFVNWVVAQFDGSIYWVNLICGFILMTGVITFARHQPLPWLALLVAVPYLFIVVGMGYSRQAVALGFILLGFVALGYGEVRRFVFFVLIGAAFHKSAVLMLPVAGLAASQSRLLSLAWAASATLIGGYIFLFDSAEHLWSTYVDQESIHSQGGLIRVLMNAVPAAVFLTLQKRLSLSESERKLWRWMSLFAIFCIPMVLISSTATDRVALYLIPLQLFVFSRIHQVTRDTTLRALIVLGVVTYYALVQAVWLFFAAHSSAWLPYQMVLFI